LGYVNSGQAYLPANLGGQRLSLLVLGSASIERLVETVAEVGVGVTRAQRLAEAIELNRNPGLRMWLFSWFAAAALLIVAIGTFGAVAMSAARRTRELGLRSALGATQRSLIALFVREQILTAVAGLAVGVGLAAWSVRLVRALLFKTAPSDPLLWFVAIVLLIVVVGAAALIPSLAASRVDPIEALREE